VEGAAIGERAVVCVRFWFDLCAERDRATDRQPASQAHTRKLIMADGGVLTMVRETKNASAQAGLVTAWWAPTLVWP
jgi:hypothetical protein